MTAHGYADSEPIPDRRNTCVVDGREIITASRLASAISAVLPHASAAREYPGLCAVLFEDCDTGLRLTATDRYTIGRFFIDCDRPGLPDSGLLIDTLDLKRFQSTVNAWASGVNEVRITWKAARRSGQPTKVTFTVNPGGSGAEHTFGALDLSFPDIASVFEAALREHADTDGYGPVERIAFDPALLKRFAKAQRSNHLEPARFRFSRWNGPAFVEVGDSFVGAIMPVRHPDVVETTGAQA